MKIAVFAGTTEGRIIIDYLADSACLIDVYVATLEGKNVLDTYKNVNVLIGRKDENELFDILKEIKYDLVIDATHPYALIVTDNIKNACEKLNLKYMRVKRDIHYDKDVYDDFSGVIDYLNHHDGNILATTGSKDLAKYMMINNYEERLYVRVLPVIDSINECIKCGIKTSHIIAMQGPFSVDANKTLLKDLNIKYMVSKLGGTSGGFPEKEQACLDLGVSLLAIGVKDLDKGLSIEEALIELNKLIAIKKRISIVGIGMGNVSNMTIEAKKAIDNATLVIGSKRITDGINGKEVIDEFRPDQIKDIISKTLHKKICVLFSGDVGFYSGAKKILDLADIYDIEVIPGISSYVYLAAKAHISYENMALISLHGRNNNIINYVSKNHLVFTLIGGDMTVNKLLELLAYYHLDNCYLYIGENLSYDNEVISQGCVKDLMNKVYAPLASVIIVNDDYEPKMQIAIKDEEFIKDTSPMTKEDIRSLSIVKMGLSRDSIVYDIGAGTGSVSIVASKIAYDGKVYAIEKNIDAIDTLNNNKIKFRCQNMEIVVGEAPDIMCELEAPTHAFIGGASGKIKDIVKMLLEKNEHIKIVLNAVTLETIAEAFEVFKSMNFKMDVTVVNVSRDKKLANYHLMNANNPVYIFVCEK